MEKETVQSYHKMIAPMFSTVSNDGTFKLSDLKGAGYKASTYKEKSGKKQWSGGCTAGSFELKTLLSNGKTDKSYFWIDCKNGVEGTTAFKDYPAGWYTRNDDGINFTKIADEVLATLVFDQGQAFWVYTAAAGLKLNAAGGVPIADVRFDTVVSYHVAVGNGMPVDYNLGDLSVTNYTASTYKEKQGKKQWSGGCTAGSFELKFLKDNGKTDKSYFWIDCKNGVEGTTAFKDYPAGWYTRNDDGINFTKIESAALLEISIPAGQGLWAYRSGAQNLQLYIPAPDVD